MGHTRKEHTQKVNNEENQQQNLKERRQKQLGWVLRALRLDLELTQGRVIKVLDELLDIEKKTIANHMGSWEAGTAKPNLERLGFLADIYKLIPEERQALFDLHKSIDDPTPIPDLPGIEEPALIQESPYPAYVVDQFNDIMSVNLHMTVYLGIIGGGIVDWDEIIKRKFPLNLYELPHGFQQDSRQFRASTLPYRHWPYFEALKTRLSRNYDSFLDDWQENPATLHVQPPLEPAQFNIQNPVTKEYIAHTATYKKFPWSDGEWVLVTFEPEEDFDIYQLGLNLPFPRTNKAIFVAHAINPPA